MELKSFEISNFRSIKNLKCVLSPKITILAGRNEAGKTSILEALQALNSNWEFKPTDKPKNIQNDEPFLIKCIFSISEIKKF